MEQGGRLYRKNELSAALGELYHANNAAAQQEYDGLNRLKTFRRGTLATGNGSIADADAARAEVFTLDAVGNWKTFLAQVGSGGTLVTQWDQDRAVNKANEITGLTQRTGNWVAPAYDACGNAVTMPRPGLPGRRRGKPGDPTASLACKYDAWNRLVEVRSGENLVAKYEYDGLGRRVKAHIDTSEPYNGTIDVYRHFYYNAAWQLLETRTATSENTEPEGLQPECQYVWSARYIDSPVLRDKNTDTDGLCDDERLYYTTDANHNVTALTDTSGAAVERYVYDPYGKVTIYDGSWSNPPRTTSSYANAILYCGYYRDGETGLYHVRNRVYNTAIGGWVQRDPLGYADGVSLYEYCGGAPASATDAMGLRPMGAGDAGYQSGYENLPWKNVDDSPAPKTAKKKPPKGQVVYIGPQGVGGKGEVPGGGWDEWSLANMGRAALNWASSAYRDANIWSEEVLDGTGYALGEGLATIGDITNPSPTSIIGGPNRAKALMDLFTGPPERLVPVVENLGNQLNGVLHGEPRPIGESIGQAIIGKATAGIVPKVVKGSGAAAVEAEKGMVLYRVFGDDAPAFGRSWTPVNPATVPNYRAAAGLFPQNTGRFVAQGILEDTAGVTTRSALAGPGGVGGTIPIPEVVVPGAATKIGLTGVWGVNPPF